MYENHLGPASDYKTREFLQSEKSELAKNLDKNSIKEEFEKIRMIEPYKSNYERKKEIIEYNAIWNTEQKKLKE